MLTSPQSITIDAVATDCHKVQEDKTSSLYASEDGTLTFRVSHQETKKRTRRMMRLDQTVIAADPLTAINSTQSAGAYLVIDEPLFGFTNAELIDLVEGLKARLDTAMLTAVLSSRH